MGGSLNSNSTDYLRKLRKVEDIISFLEKFKSNMGNSERKHIDKTIDILVRYGNKLAEGEERELKFFNNVFD